MSGFPLLVTFFLISSFVNFPFVRLSILLFRVNFGEKLRIYWTWRTTIACWGVGFDLGEEIELKINRQTLCSWPIVRNENFILKTPPTPSNMKNLALTSRKIYIVVNLQGDSHRRREISFIIGNNLYLLPEK